MTDCLHIAPISPWRTLQAIRFIAGGAQRDAQSRRSAAAIMDAVDHQTHRGARIWVARRKRRLVAAAMTITSMGRCGMLFHSPPSARNVEVDALIEVVREVSKATIAEEAAFVQAILPTHRDDAANVLQKAGFRPLAEILIMNRRLADDELLLEPQENRYQWLRYGEYGPDELEALIEATFDQTLDCPGLADLRSARDVMHCHQSPGVFYPEGWLLARKDGQAAGCVLINKLPPDDATATPDHAVELVYMGVSPAFRGQGLGRMLLRRGLRQGRLAGAKLASLAVDSANHYAIAIYERENFQPMYRRNVFILRAW